MSVVKTGPKPKEYKRISKFEWILSLSSRINEAQIIMEKKMLVRKNWKKNKIILIF